MPGQNDYFDRKIYFSGDFRRAQPAASAPHRSFDPDGFAICFTGPGPGFFRPVSSADGGILVRGFLGRNGVNLLNRY